MFCIRCRSSISLFAFRAVDFFIALFPCSTFFLLLIIEWENVIWLFAADWKCVVATNVSLRFSLYRPHTFIHHTKWESTSSGKKKVNGSFNVTFFLCHTHKFNRSCSLQRFDFSLVRFIFSNNFASATKIYVRSSEHNIYCNNLSLLESVNIVYNRVNFQSIHTFYFYINICACAWHVCSLLYRWYNRLFFWIFFQ